MTDLQASGFTPVHNRYFLPNVIERTPLGERAMNPYDKMFQERMIFVGMPIDDTVANDVMAQLLTLESSDPDRDIIMYINSPGGSFTAMTAIYDTMQYVHPDVSTICLGQAASAAAVLLAAGTPGKRLALPNSRVIIHQPATEGGYGQGSDIEIQAREIMRMRSQLEEMLSKHSGRDLALVKKDIDRDKILNAEEAKDYGLIDIVISTRKKSLVSAGK
jgi:ATP-dependent Clp protease, protease subunit